MESLMNGSDIETAAPKPAKAKKAVAKKAAKKVAAKKAVTARIPRVERTVPEAKAGEIYIQTCSKCDYKRERRFFGDVSGARGAQHSVENRGHVTSIIVAKDVRERNERGEGKKVVAKVAKASKPAKVAKTAKPAKEKASAIA